MYFLRLLAAVSTLAIMATALPLNENRAQRLYHQATPVQIGDPEAVGYGDGGGAKVADDPNEFQRLKRLTQIGARDAYTIDSRAQVWNALDKAEGLRKRVQIGNPDDGYGNGGGASVSDVLDEIEEVKRNVQIGDPGTDGSYGNGGGASVSDALEEMENLNKRVQIGDPDTTGYGNGGGAKVADDWESE